MQANPLTHSTLYFFQLGLKVYLASFIERVFLPFIVFCTLHFFLLQTNSLLFPLTFGAKIEKHAKSLWISLLTPLYGWRNSALLTFHVTLLCNFRKVGIPEYSHYEVSFQLVMCFGQIKFNQNKPFLPVISHML